MKFKSLSLIVALFMLLTVVTVPVLTETVHADVPPQADQAKNTIILPNQIIADKEFTIRIIGDRQNNIDFNSDNVSNAVEGETAYLPIGVSIFFPPSKSWIYYQLPHSKGPQDEFAEISPSTTFPGTTSIRVAYDYYKHTSGSWRKIGESTKTFKCLILGTIKLDPDRGYTTKSTILSNYGKLPTASRSGYKFMGWYTTKTGGARIAHSSNVKFSNFTKTLYARWTKNTSVKFNANKGKVSKKSKAVKYNYKYGKLPTPKRTNYKFKGWYTKKSGGTKVTQNSTVAVSKKHTLYARWVGPKGKNKTISNAEYKRIKKGMTYSDVKFLVGGSGRLESASSDGKSKFKTYSWKRSSDFKAFVLFKDGKVQSKER